MDNHISTALSITLTPDELVFAVNSWIRNRYKNQVTSDFISNLELEEVYCDDEAVVINLVGKVKEER